MARPPAMTDETKERIWADAYTAELRRLLDTKLGSRAAQYGARAHARLVLRDAINKVAAP